MTLILKIIWGIEMSNLILTSTVLKAKKKIATLLPFEVSQVSSLQLSRLSSQLCLVVVITMADTGYNTNILNVVNRYGLSVTDMFRLSYALLIQYL